MFRFCLRHVVSHVICTSSLLLSQCAILLCVYERHIRACTGTCPLQVVYKAFKENLLVLKTACIDVLRNRTSMSVCCASFRASSLSDSSGGLITTAHTSPYLFCPSSSCTYNSPTIKNENVHAYFIRILNFCVV